MARRLLVLCLGLAVVAGVGALRGVDPQPLEIARLKVFDLYQQLQPRAYREAPVRVVDIDETSLARYGQWPWPRTVLAGLVDRLDRAGTAAIVFDMVFSEPDRTSPRRLTQLWPDSPQLARLREELATLPDHDEMLAGALSATRSVGGFIVTRGESASNGAVAGGRPPPPRKAGFAHGGSDPAEALHGFDGAVRNLPAFEEAVAGYGVISLVPEVDNVVRRVPLLVDLDGTIYPSLSLEALRLAFGASTIVARSIDASGEVAAGQTGLADLKVGPLEVPLTRRGELWVRFTEPVPERVIPAAAVLETDPAELQAALEGTIVLIGTSAPGLRDLRATPLRPAEPGVLVHAQMIEQMLFGDHLKRPDWAAGAELLTLLLAGGLVVLAAPFVSALWGAAVALVAAGAAFAGSWLAFAERALLLDPVAPVLGVVAAYLTAMTAQYLLTERERERVRQAFGQYLAPALVEQLARDPKKLKLGGEVRELTLLFLDLRGFTAMSERLTAEEVTRFLNRFLTPMTEAVMAHGGTVDKYMGDALMAFWNAPLDQPDHAARACRAALAVRGRFAALKAELGAPELGIGVGLNTGPASVGNMGSTQRFDYSAIGDTVNTASRLEGLSKLYGLDIVAGEGVRAAAPELAWLELDRVRVVGKSRPVTVHTLLAEAPDGAIRALATAHETALAAYRARDWPAARAAFAAAADLAPDWLQPLYILYATRIDALEADPPGDDWDGVFAAKGK
jgi:adenylate cyclase